MDPEEVPAEELEPRPAPRLRGVVEQPAYTNWEGVTPPSEVVDLRSPQTTRRSFGS
jgi:hypothetical protein